MRIIHYIPLHTPDQLTLCIQVFGPVEQERLKRLIQKQAETEQAKSEIEQQANVNMVVEPAIEPTTETVPNGGAAMQVDGQAQEQTGETKKMSKAERERLYLSRNAFKKKMKARAKSAVRNKLKTKRR